MSHWSTKTEPQARPKLIIDCQQINAKHLYKILIGSILPRPIAWVSTRSPEGINNLAPFSFFNVFSVKPPILGFAPGFKRPDDAGVRPPKDTLRNVLDTGEFVVNLVSYPLANQMNQSSGDYPEDVSEFDAVGLTPAPCRIVQAPRVAECLISMECKLYKRVELGEGNLILGEILFIHMDENVLRHDGEIDLEVLQPIGRLGGDGYSTVKDRFDIARP